MAKRIEIKEGERYGRLTIIREVEPKREPHKVIRRFLCKCDCGKEVVCRLGNIRYGTTRSCGCHRKYERGIYKSRLYRIWTGIIDRCTHKRKTTSKHYALINVSMCNEWRNNFMAFYNWAMKHGYNDDLSIDRIDNNGGYYPDNCRWATPVQQANNKSNNIIVTRNGESHTAAEWCNIIGLSYKTFKTRYYTLHLSAYDSIFLPVKRGKRNCKKHCIPYNEETAHLLGTTDEWKGVRNDRRKESTQGGNFEC